MKGTAVAHLDLWALSLKQRQHLKGNLSCGWPALTPGWVLPEPSCCPRAVMLLGWDCQAGTSSVWAGCLLCAGPTSDQESHQPGPIGCHLPIMASDGVPPWTPSCHHQGRGRKPWLPVFTRQLRRRQPVQRPWVRSAVRSSGQSGDGGRGRPQTKCPRGAGEMRPGAAAVISVTGTRGTAAPGSGCSADAAETLQF